MKVYVYKNGLCDPEKGLGTARQLATSKDVDDFIDLFCASLDPRYIKNWRIFVTNDEVEWVEVDHYSFMGEALYVGVKSKVQEVDLHERSLQVNKQLQTITQARERAKQKADKRKEERNARTKKA